MTSEAGSHMFSANAPRPSCDMPVRELEVLAARFADHYLPSRGWARVYSSEGSIAEYLWLRGYTLCDEGADGAPLDAVFAGPDEARLAILCGSLRKGGFVFLSASRDHAAPRGFRELSTGVVGVRVWRRDSFRRLSDLVPSRHG